MDGAMSGMPSAPSSESCGSHLGDLMSNASSSATPSLLRTATASGADDVASRFSPLERLLITANGNLQRIVSSYHARPVEVVVRHNIPLAGAPGSFKRAVDIFLLGGNGLLNSNMPGGNKYCFCRATSRVVVTSPRMLDALASKRIGIGQLFKHFE